jgi:hypothetical protein
MITFEKTATRYLDDTTVIPTEFLSLKIRKSIYDTLGFVPDNAYIGNAAGDWVFISVVKDKQVYTFTDSYYLDQAHLDKE